MSNNNNNPEESTIGEIKAEPTMPKPEGYDEWCKSLTIRKHRYHHEEQVDEEEYVIGYDAIMTVSSGLVMIRYTNYWISTHDYELLISRDAFCALLDRIALLEEWRKE